MKAAAEGAAELAHNAVEQGTEENSRARQAADAARGLMRGQRKQVAAKSLMSRLGDHFSGVIYTGLVMVLGVVMFVKTGNTVNVTAVDSLIDTLTNAISTGAGLLVLLILAIIFGYAMFYMDFATSAGGGSSKT
ncbi:MAG: hypothetical protein ABEK04_03615 [Candidatus Nanohalobium sp.]